MAKHPIEMMLELTNILGNAAWLDLANNLVSRAKDASDLTPEDVDALAEIMIMSRARHIAEEAAKKNPAMQEHLRKLQKAAELVDDPASDQMIDEINNLLNQKPKDNEND